MRQSHLMLSNTLILWASHILLVVPQLILVPFLIATIGEGGYGLYALVWPLMMAIDRLEQSLQSGVVKYCAAFLAENDLDRINKVISSSFVYSVLLAFLTCAGFLIAAAMCGGAFGGLGAPLAILSVTILLMIPLTPYIAVIQARQRYYVGAVAETASQYGSLVAVLAWFHLVGPSVEAIVFIKAGMLLMSRLVQLPVAWHLVPGLRNRPALFEWKSFQMIASFGSVTVLLALCAIVNTTGMRWLLGVLESTRFVAHLAILLMPVLLLMQVVSAMTITVMPATSAYAATGNQRILQELLLRSTQYTAILVLGALIVAVLLMPSMLAVWVGPRYVFLAPYSLALFGSAAFMLVSTSAHHMLKGLGRLRAMLAASFVSQIVLPLAVVLAFAFGGGNPYLSVTVGLALGNVVLGVAQLGLASKALHIPFPLVIGSACGRPTAIAGVICAGSLGLIALTGLDGLFGRFAISGAAVLAYFSACYAFVASSEERRQTQQFVQLAATRLAAIGVSIF